MSPHGFSRFHVLNINMPECLFSRKIVNPHFYDYKNKRPRVVNPRDYYYFPVYVDVPCGTCINCLKNKQSAWRLRLNAELNNADRQYTSFLTLTFNDKSIDHYGIKKPSDCYFAVRSFLDNLRQRPLDPHLWCRYPHTRGSLLLPRLYGSEDLGYAGLSPTEREAVYKLGFKDQCLPPGFRYHKSRRGHSCKHWFATEFGEDPRYTGRIHLHGILFNCTASFSQIQSCWPYGFTWVSPVKAQTASYITKYITKYFSENKAAPAIYSSPGIGSSLAGSSQFALYLQGRKSSVVSYRGSHYAIPRYLLDKLDPGRKYRRSEDHASVERRELSYPIWTKQVGSKTFSDHREYIEFLIKKQSDIYHGTNSRRPSILAESVQHGSFGASFDDGMSWGALPPEDD
ncbi:replication initiator protein [Dipodfec virus RodF1_49]|uniref:Replication initiator protein n=1 Tax=Dipodfec virus RodF1_49 TaxID=2929299 RepID=A0A976N2Q0_9VIRU|nr:replication initiator protein [Dipodfec virus RodF1_49]